MVTTKQKPIAGTQKIKKSKHTTQKKKTKEERTERNYKAARKQLTKWQ